MDRAVTWWRSQRAAFAALALAAITAAGAYLWLDVLPSLRDSGTVTAADETAEVAEQTIALGAVTWDDYEAPAGSRTLSVRIRASGGPDSGSCTVTTLTDRSSGRTWVSSRQGLDVPYDDGERSCIASATSYGIQLVFLLPDDAVGPFDLDIGTTGEVARFRIDP